MCLAVNEYVKCVRFMDVLKFMCPQACDSEHYICHYPLLNDTLQILVLLVIHAHVACIDFYMSITHVHNYCTGTWLGTGEDTRHTTHALGESSGHDSLQGTAGKRTSTIDFGYVRTSVQLSKRCVTLQDGAISKFLVPKEEAWNKSFKKVPKAWV